MELLVAWFSCCPSGFLVKPVCVPAASWYTWELGMAVGGKPLCCGYILLGPHKLGSSFKPDALEGFGCCRHISSSITCWLCLVCQLAQGSAFAGVTSSQNVAAALGWEQQLLERVAQTGWVRWQDRFCSSQLVKQAAKSRLCISLHM